jgi:5-methylcytosine-specific restriction endonuclease McrA
VGIPSADDQIRFLRDMQALLEDGQFVATYKFALLTALADLAVESGVTDDRRIALPVRSIAEKFIEYYWQQSAPFMGGDVARVLKQNTGKQAAVIVELMGLRAKGLASLPQLRASAPDWNAAVGRVARVVRVMPLFRLQYVGGILRPFLYPHRLQNDAVELVVGVAYCLRKFHTMITGLARDRWIAMVRQIEENLYLVGQSQDIERFMFGAEREPIRRHLDLLTNWQRGLCLYCERSLSRQTAHVDHFVPWVLHRCDALPNLVAAHAQCNMAKADWLAAEPHLVRWMRRNESLASAFEPGITPLATQRNGTTAIAKWAYDRAYELGLPTWFRSRETMKLSDGYRALFSEVSSVPHGRQG